MENYDDFRIKPFIFHNKSFYVKHDELLDPFLSGNKYWKLHALIQMPKERYKQLFSYGGTQSNAMLSLAVLCHQKGWTFHYTCKPVPSHLKQQPSGNLSKALDLGMLLHEVSHDDYEHCVQRLREDYIGDAESLFVPQGGADPMAQLGVQKLADEIKQWQHTQYIERLNIVTPSGTGTTAYYLAQALPKCKILTTAVVGDKAYLQAQMEILGEIPSNISILEGTKKYQFAQLYPELLKVYDRLLDAGVTFDLIYGAVMWHVLLQHYDAVEGMILYVHSGGLMGNASMLDRYRHKGML
ncbi:MAG: 1-aminocyclopropane-1-carboxylate deaminase [Mariprofundaceae bacterium]|nr:1-aminocyclopropane-1-carboxylate deaminase [Mariprofundaceae bacterium]